MDTECPVCKEIFTEPMEKKCGHPVCRACLKLGSRDIAVCPVCKNDNDTPWRRLFYLERYCKNLPWKCECGETMTYKERIAHEQDCKLKQVQCPIEKCDFTGMPHEIAEHLVKVHVNYAIKEPSKNTLSIAFKEQRRDRFLGTIAQEYELESATLQDMGQKYMDSLN